MKELPARIRYDITVQVYNASSYTKKNAITKRYRIIKCSRAPWSLIITTVCLVISTCKRHYCACSTGDHQYLRLLQNYKKILKNLLITIILLLIMVNTKKNTWLHGHGPQSVKKSVCSVELYRSIILLVLLARHRAAVSRYVICLRKHQSVSTMCLSEMSEGRRSALWPTEKKLGRCDLLKTESVRKWPIQ